MRTQSGFSISEVLSKIIPDINKLDFKEKCVSYSGGASWYDDSIYGKLSFSYHFSGKSLFILFSKAECICYCESDICEGTCYDVSVQSFANWSKYYEETHEELELSEKQVRGVMMPDLFNSL